MCSGDSMQPTCTRRKRGKKKQSHQSGAEEPHPLFLCIHAAAERVFCIEDQCRRCRSTAHALVSGRGEISTQFCHVSPDSSFPDSVLSPNLAAFLPLFHPFHPILPIFHHSSYSILPLFHSFHPFLPRFHPFHPVFCPYSPVLSRFHPKAYSHSAAFHPILPLAAVLARNDGIGGGAGGAA